MMKGKEKAVIPICLAGQDKGYYNGIYTVYLPFYYIKT